MDYKKTSYCWRGSTEKVDAVREYFEGCGRKIDESRRYSSPAKKMTLTTENIYLLRDRVIGIQKLSLEYENDASGSEEMFPQDPRSEVILAGESESVKEIGEGLVKILGEIKFTESCLFEKE